MIRDVQHVSQQQHQGYQLEEDRLQQIFGLLSIAEIFFVKIGIIFIKNFRLNTKFPQQPKKKQFRKIYGMYGNTYILYTEITENTEYGLYTDSTENTDTATDTAKTYVFMQHYKVPNSIVKSQRGPLQLTNFNINFIILQQELVLVQILMVQQILILSVVGQVQDKYGFLMW
eukprot:TRINITY_DN914_c1_g3_i2.p3 TRINITY_DN914_c1_g3~~TRINITY_DN914_c1_g3_i2.p3  ORF type:complete len:172 (+),score=1.79 TRINITY_DN914_c1_g3_i2:531-1046(+)